MLSNFSCLLLLSSVLTFSVFFSPDFCRGWSKNALRYLLKGQCQSWYTLLGLIFPGLERGILNTHKISAVIKNPFYYKCFTTLIFGANIQHFQKFLSFDIILVSKLMCDFLWLKFFNNSANILSWNQSCILGIFLFWYWIAEKVCCLYLVWYQRGEMPWERDCHEAYKVGTNTKEIFFTKYDVPFILRISFVNLHQSTDSCRCISIKGTL